MAKEIDWYDLPYNHAGRWERKYVSIMNPVVKVTWPQFIAEMVIYWRTQILKTYKDIKIGDGWYKPITKAVRDLNQQACVLCNYFPHPDDEKMVEVAFKNFFRRNRSLKLGQHRKVRYTEKNGRKVLNITQDEKDVVIGVTAELNILLEKRNIFQKEGTKLEEAKKPETVTFNTSTPKKSKLANLLALEQKLKEQKQ